ncbi:recombinase family protein [Microbacterium sp. UFMG61]|uniref:recombinase family protein n=1 Tax=Microbacterium sp. UFMG61 TaxID=2745935 RepID=UPI00188FB880|nr:recombinase family protein [Microbacterium sp. UFMG61]
MSETIDPLKATASVDEALTSPLHLPHAAAECPKCFTELQQNRDFWSARPDGSRLVGLVVSREGMPSVVEQRDDLTRFGVPIEGFRHPAPDILESWSDRLSRLIATLNKGDVLVVANINALGRDADEGVRAAAELRRHGIIVKVLSHDARHLADAVR